jgi:hypothetical protein
MDRRSLYKIAQGGWAADSNFRRVQSNALLRREDLRSVLILDLGPSPISSDRSYDYEGSELSFP